LLASNHGLREYSKSAGSSGPIGSLVNLVASAGVTWPTIYPTQAACSVRHSYDGPSPSNATDRARQADRGPGDEPRAISVASWPPGRLRATALCVFLGALPTLGDDAALLPRPRRYVRARPRRYRTVLATGPPFTPIGHGSQPCPTDGAGIRRSRWHSIGRRRVRQIRPRRRLRASHRSEIIFLRHRLFELVYRARRRPSATHPICSNRSPCGSQGLDPDAVPLLSLRAPLDGTVRPATSHLSTRGDRQTLATAPRRVPVVLSERRPRRSNGGRTPHSLRSRLVFPRSAYLEGADRWTHQVARRCRLRRLGSLCGARHRGGCRSRAQTQSASR
jgi:hypothetical protein